jgi:hypothetical protein
LGDALVSEHTEWCRRHFTLMAEEGVWGVPRWGLVFQKRGDRLVLIERMPHEPGMPMTTAQVRELQDDGFAATRQEFGLAGIEVIDGTDEHIDRVDADLSPMPPLDGSRRR